MTTPAGVAYAPTLASESHAQREDASVGVERELRAAQQVAAVRRGEEFLDALGRATSPGASARATATASTTSSG